jgi:hypothetical protein
MTLQELKAMNLALEALMYASYEDIEYNDACAAKVLEARNALKEALAQPEQEPVAWMWDVNNGGGYTSKGIGFMQTNIPFAKHTSLFTTPPQRTEQEPVIGKWSLREVYFDEDGEPISHRSPPQRTEPVAHWSDCAVHSEPAYPKGECDCGGIVAVADYTALSDKYVALSDKYVALKAQRTWVGLTNNELQPIADEYRILFGSWVEDFARAIEAKLRSKNGY